MFTIFLADESWSAGLLSTSYVIRRYPPVSLSTPLNAVNEFESEYGSGLSLVGYAVALVCIVVLCCLASVFFLSISLPVRFMALILLLILLAFVHAFQEGVEVLHVGEGSRQFTV